MTQPIPAQERKRRRAIYMKAWRLKNRDKVNKINAEYVKRNWTKVRAKQKEYRLKNLNRANAWRRTWREATREKRREVDGAYVAAHYDRTRVTQRIGQRTYSARLAASFVEAIDKEVVRQRAEGVCGICGNLVEKWQKGETDHIIPLSKGGLTCYANLQWAHMSCNRKKHAAIPSAAGRLR